MYDAVIEFWMFYSLAIGDVVMPTRCLQPFSRHTNLQEKLLGDLPQKILCGVHVADFGPRPCNCPRKFKVNGECTYSGTQFTCWTAGCVYKISCYVPNCNCFYMGKSQRYVETRVQEDIGENTKLYNTRILLPNRTATRSTSPSTPLQHHKPCYGLH